MLNLPKNIEATTEGLVAAYDAMIAETNMPTGMAVQMHLTLEMADDAEEVLEILMGICGDQLEQMSNRDRNALCKWFVKFWAVAQSVEGGE